MNFSSFVTLLLFLAASIGAFAPAVAIKPSQAATCKALLEAVLQEDYRQATTLVSQDTACIDTPNANGVTPLLMAVYKGNKELVLLFLRTGANLHATASSLKDFTLSPSLSTRTHKTTALMLACAMGNLEIVKILLQKGASVNIQDSIGQTALHYTILGDFSWPHTPLSDTRKAIISLLLSAGANSHLADDHGLDALYYYKEVAGLSRGFLGYEFDQATLAKDPLYKTMENRA